MTFPWRRKRGGAKKREASKGAIRPRMEIAIPTYFRCPISLDLMRDPVSLSTGITYDRASIEKWIDSGNMTCPVSNVPLRNFDVIPNHSLRKMIQEWCVDNKAHGVERIPTPRIPITPFDVSEISSSLLLATSNGDVDRCRDLLKKMDNLAKESERNKGCIVENGMGSKLARMFEFFASSDVSSSHKHNNLLKQILSMLTWSFPLGQEGVTILKSKSSLHYITRSLNPVEDDIVRKNSILILKELISEDQDCVKGLTEIDGVEESLIQIATHFPKCPKSTQACLIIINHIINNNQENNIPITKFLQLGLVPLLLDTLVDHSNKNVSEKALGVLDSISNIDEGKKTLNSNALTIPLVVKKILRVSDASTQFCVSILWKLRLGENQNALIESVEHGGFQKLLVVLQVGCGERTKEKVSELLKLMNMYRNKLDCFDSYMGFKYRST